MNRWAVIDQDTYVVVNVIIWDGVSEWNPPPNTFLIESDEAQMYWIYNPQDGTFTNPNIPVED